MSSHGNAASVNDPRQPSAAKPYVAPMVSPQDLPVDYSGFIAVIFGIVGVMFRYKLSSWLAIVFCAQSLANMRNVENDLKQISMAMMFAIMGLVTNYFGPARPGTKS
ncbi:protein Asterix [Alnus glutinosa]|uniref:protein Asterix n=1 Tax=Alnus glutinosa TaxID=3517 RepID=UPI002D77E805|nr:protein Asterix [Alnus glutinosa]